MIAIWKDIAGYEGLYQISTMGEVRRILDNGQYRMMRVFVRKTKKGTLYLVKLTKNSKGKSEKLWKLMALTFLGPVPKGCVPYHKDGCASNNTLTNIAYIDQKQLGQMIGGENHKPVAQINNVSEIVKFYPSARKAAQENYISYSALLSRCNGKCKSIFAPDGYAYAWEDDTKRVELIINTIKGDLADGIK